jgi:hypothetical protein
MLPAGIASFKLRHPSTFVMTEVAAWCTDIAVDTSQDSEEVSLFNPGGTTATKVTNFGAISRNYTLSIKWRPEAEVFFSALSGAVNVPFEYAPRGTAVGQIMISGATNVGGWAGPGGSASGSLDASLSLSPTVFLSATIITAPAAKTITSSSVADPTLITTSAPHALVVGSVVVIAGHTGATPSLNGAHTVTTVPTTTTFTIPVSVTVGGTGGTVQD